MALSDDLWGGQLVGVAFDPVAHVCDLRVSTLDHGVTRTYEIACREVSELRFHNAIPLPWSYADVTEVHVQADACSGRQVLEMLLWSEEAGLVVTCSSIDIRETGGAARERVPVAG